jgi:virginiamycin B lyase
MWFAESQGNKIGRITMAGTMKEFIIKLGVDSEPTTIVSAPSGPLYFTEFSANHVSSITVAGVVTRHKVPTSSSHPLDLTVGVGGQLWFTEFQGNKIGVLTP